MSLTLWEVDLGSYHPPVASASTLVGEGASVQEQLAICATFSLQVPPTLLPQRC